MFQLCLILCLQCVVASVCSRVQSGVQSLLVVWGCWIKGWLWYAAEGLLCFWQIGRICVTVSFELLWVTLLISGRLSTLLSLFVIFETWFGSGILLIDNSWSVKSCKCSQRLQLNELLWRLTRFLISRCDSLRHAEWNHYVHELHTTELSLQNYLP